MIDAILKAQAIAKTRSTVGKDLSQVQATLWLRPTAHETTPDASVIKKIFVDMDSLERPISADLAGSRSGFPDLNLKRRSFTMDRSRLEQPRPLEDDGPDTCLSRVEMKRRAMEREMARMQAADEAAAIASAAAVAAEEPEPGLDEYLESTAMHTGN